MPFGVAFGTFRSPVQEDHIGFHHPTYSIQPLIDVGQAFLVYLDIVDRWGQGMKILKIVEKHVPSNSLMNGIDRVEKRLCSSLLLVLLLPKSVYFLLDSTSVVVDCRYFVGGSRKSG